MEQKYILITGIAGLLGSRLADWIIENKKEYKIIGIDNLFGGYIENVNPEVIFYKKELSYDDISDIFKQYKIEYVFHFAAYAAEGLSPFMRKFNWSNNVLSTVNIINMCVTYDVKRLIYTSSMSVYGKGVTLEKRFDENDQPLPEDPYAISKYACELDIKSAGAQFGLDWCIIRPHNVYGKNQNIWDKYRNVLGIWMVQTLNNQPITIYGDGLQTRAFSYIDDCLEPFWLAATSDKASKEIINLGGIKKYTIKEAAEIVSEITRNKNIVYKEPRFEVKHAIPTYQKSINILNYKESKNLREGIEEMWEWAKQQPKRKQHKWENYEITKNLYSYWK